MSRVRIHVSSGEIAANLKDGGDRPPIVVRAKQEEYLFGHEAAITCECCGEVAAIIVNPAGAPLGQARVWIETEGKVVVFVRAVPNSRRSYRKVGEAPKGD